MRHPNSPISSATACKHTKTDNDERGRLSSLTFGFASKDFPQNPPRVGGWQTCWPTDTYMAALPPLLLEFHISYRNEILSMSTQKCPVLYQHMEEMSQRGFFPPLHWRVVSPKVFHVYTIWRQDVGLHFILKPDLWLLLVDRKAAQRDLQYTNL